MTTFKARIYKLAFAAMPLVAATCATGTTDKFGSTGADTSSSASGSDVSSSTSSAMGGMGGDGGKGMGGAAGVGGTGDGGAMAASSSSSGGGGGVTCAMDMDCLSGQWCNAGTCDVCNTDAKCGAGCVPCPAPTPHCLIMGPSSACVQCISDMDCGAGGMCVGGSCNDACTMSAKSYDFESDVQGFTHAPTSGILEDDPWEWGKPDGMITCHGGTNCFVTELGTAGYRLCQTAALVSPAIDLSKCMGTSKVITLSFWHYYQFEPMSSGRWWDGGVLQFSADNGGTWTDITTNQPYQGVINGAYGDCTPDPEIGGHQGWSGTVPGGAWVQVSADLATNYLVSGFKFRFLFGADEGGRFRGWFIDDVAITPH